MDSYATTNSHQCTRSAVKKISGRYVEHRTATMRTISTGWECVRLSIKPLGRFSTSFAFGDREKHYRLPLNNLRSVPEGYTDEQIYMVRLLRSLVCSDIRVQLLYLSGSVTVGWHDFQSRFLARANMFLPHNLESWTRGFSHLDICASNVEGRVIRWTHRWETDRIFARWPLLIHWSTEPWIKENG